MFREKLRKIQADLLSGKEFSEEELYDIVEDIVKNPSIIGSDVLWDIVKIYTLSERIIRVYFEAHLNSIFYMQKVPEDIYEQLGWGKEKRESHDFEIVKLYQDKFYYCCRGCGIYAEGHKRAEPYPILDSDNLSCAEVQIRNIII